jgi:pimeloyl-ACP methyl ester carboxylesterase
VLDTRVRLLADVTLVGHSLAGAMAPAVATDIPDRLAHVINLDGFLTAKGESFKDALPEMWDEFRRDAEAGGDPWWSPPPAEWDFGLTGDDRDWARPKLTPHPLRTWIDPLPIDDSKWAGISRTFVSCTSGLSPSEIVDERRRYIERNWGYQAIDSVHDAMIATPRLLADTLMEIALSTN